jgi:hypothetical protein
MRLHYLTGLEPNLLATKQAGHKIQVTLNLNGSHFIAFVKTCDSCY